jgi:hypothetical protein
MIILEIYIIAYLLGLLEPVLTRGLPIFETRREFKRSFIPFYFLYKWYKELPE